MDEGDLCVAGACCVVCLCFVALGVGWILLELKLFKYLEFEHK